MDYIGPETDFTLEKKINFFSQFFTLVKCERKLMNTPSNLQISPLLGCGLWSFFSSKTGEGEYAACRSDQRPLIF